MKMKIKVVKDELDFTHAATMLGNPIIIKKLTETSLIVKDGETIVISGLTKETKGDGDAGVPWLKDVPVLGWVFKADNKNEAMEEILIFITPHILPVAKDQDKIAGTDNGGKQKIEIEPDQNKTSNIPEKKTSVDSTK
jgi:type IV pilus assembly protein PilQ